MNIYINYYYCIIHQWYLVLFKIIQVNDESKLTIQSLKINNVYNIAMVNV